MSRGKYIVVLGPDGSGKTTVADKLAEDFKTEGKVVVRLDFAFGIMPSISRFLGREERKAAPEGKLNAGMIKPLSRSRALILACWYGLDHILGHWRLRCANSDEVFVFARSYHDFLYQRAYANLPLLVPRLFLALGPTPDLVATPFRDARKIHEQKPELTEAEIREQYAKITKRLLRYDYCSRIDANDGITSTINDIHKNLCHRT